MIEFDYETLSSLGLTPALAARAAALPVPDGVAGQLLRITHVHRESVGLHDGRKEQVAR